VCVALHCEPIVPGSFPARVHVAPGYGAYQTAREEKEKLSLLMGSRSVTQLRWKSIILWICMCMTLFRFELCSS